jgi:hypothetical protein
VICCSVADGWTFPPIPGGRVRASGRATLCRFARELAVGARRVEVVRLQTGIDPGVSEGDGLLVPRELTFEGVAMLVLAPSDDAPDVEGFGLLVLRKFSGAVPPGGAARLVCAELLKDGMGDLDRAEGTFDVAFSCDESEDFVLVLVDGFCDTAVFSAADLGGTGGLGAGAAGFGAGFPAPIFQTFRTNDFADARNPKRDGFALSLSI